MKINILVTDKPWHDNLFDSLSKDNKIKWIRIKNKIDFSYENLMTINPDFIFIPHWSYIIPKSIYNNFKCILFHMTDLPYGRGGSPLQNLIARGITDTKISAISVSKEIDSGKIYLKKNLNLNGTAEEIFIRSSMVIENMILYIIKYKPTPKEQEGKVVEFKRRSPKDSNITRIKDLKKMYDYIRMLDCDGYPNAFFETKYLKFEFSRAKLKSDNSIFADVRIIKK